MKTERILLKISGASLKTNDDSIICSNKINDLVNQIKFISKKYSIGIVIGGGNIWRGIEGKKLKMNDNLSDSMGMLSTIMNSLALNNSLNSNNVKSKVFSSIKCDELCNEYIYRDVEEWMNTKETVSIFAGGTGSPFFTTDTAAALRASQTDCKVIYMGKNGVDGVYSSDPKKDKNAVHYSELSYKDVLSKKLDVMDLTALTLCEKNNIKIIVFNIDNKNSIIDTIENKTKQTIIKG